MRLRLLMLLCLPALCQAGKDDTFFLLDSLPVITGTSYADPGLPLVDHWKFRMGDDSSWASPGYDDSGWSFMKPSGFRDLVKKDGKEYTGWFRMHLRIDSSMLKVPLGLFMVHGGASEVYIDGKLVARYGRIHTSLPDSVERVNPNRLPLLFWLEDSIDHLIAIRYCNPSHMRNQADPLREDMLDIKVAGFRQGNAVMMMQRVATTGIFIFYFTFFLALSFLHLMFYLFYRSNRSNLYYSIFAGSFGTMLLFVLFRVSGHDVDSMETYNYVISYLSPVYCTALLAMLNSIYYEKFLKTFWIWCVLALISCIRNIWTTEIEWFDTTVYILFGVECMRIIFNAIRKKKEGAWILGGGIFATIIFFTLVIVFSALGISMTFGGPGVLGMIIGLCVVYATISIPVSMTIYLARDFAKTSRKLEKKLKEVEELSARTLEQEKEKQRILETQKEVLEQQVKERTFEISEQKKIIEEKNKDITDSITYARRIQESILPREEYIRSIFPESFVLYRPKDIVSGDFYWFGEAAGKKIAVSADCTGHGVPGALMSMIGSNLLNQVILEKNITDPAEVLAALDKFLASALHQKNEEEGDGIGKVRDGMDVAIIAWDPVDRSLRFAGAQRPLWLVKEGRLSETRSDKASIGGVKHEYFTGFTCHSLKPGEGTFVFLSSDGYADQFGGGEGKKLMTKEFKKQLEKYSGNGLLYTKERLESDFESWRGNRDQVDDVLVIGIKL